MWAFARVVDLEPRFKSWVPDSVCSSVEAWDSTAIDIEECLAVLSLRMFASLVADVGKSFGFGGWEGSRLCVSCPALPGCFGHSDFECSAEMQF